MRFSPGRPPSRFATLRSHLDHELERMDRGLQRITHRKARPGMMDRLGGEAGKLGAVAGLLVADIGLVAAALAWRDRLEARTRLHVVPDGRSGWTVRLDGSPAALGTFPTRRAAVRTARSAAVEAAPSQLVIHNEDGSVARTRRYRTR